MEIIRQKKEYGFTSNTADKYNSMAVLENDVWLLVHDNGTAVGSDGRQYARVSREVQSEPIHADELMQYVCFSVDDFDKPPEETFPIPDTDLITLGWEPDADRPVILPLSDSPSDENGECEIVHN